MEWKGILIGLGVLIVLVLLVRAFRGLGIKRAPHKKDSADLWLKADPGPRDKGDDAPLVGPGSQTDRDSGD